MVCVSWHASHLSVVQELEVAGSAGSFVHGMGQLQRPSPALRPVVTWHGIRRAALFRNLAHEVNLCLGVCPEGSPQGDMWAVAMTTKYVFKRQNNNKNHIPTAKANE